MLPVDLVAVSVKPTETLRASPNRNNGFSTDTDIGSRIYIYYKYNTILQCWRHCAYNYSKIVRTSTHKEPGALQRV